MAVWIPVTVVPVSAATWRMDTFITDVSSVMRNWLAASTIRTPPPAFLAPSSPVVPVVPVGPVPAPVGISASAIGAAYVRPAGRPLLCEWSRAFRSDLAPAVRTDPSPPGQRRVSHPRSILVP